MRIPIVVLAFSFLCGCAQQEKNDQKEEPGNTEQSVDGNVLDEEQELGA